MAPDPLYSDDVILMLFLKFSPSLFYFFINNLSLLKTKYSVVYFKYPQFCLFIDDENELCLQNNSRLLQLDMILKNKMWIDRATGAIMTSQALYTIIKEYDEI
jgi:hypothetical protein